MKALLSAMGVLGLVAAASASQPLWMDRHDDFGPDVRRPCIEIGDCKAIPKPLPEPWPCCCRGERPFPKLPRPAPHEDGVRVEIEK